MVVFSIHSTVCEFAIRSSDKETDNDSLALRTRFGILSLTSTHACLIRRQSRWRHIGSYIEFNRKHIMIPTRHSSQRYGYSNERFVRFRLARVLCISSPSVGANPNGQSHNLKRNTFDQMSQRSLSVANDADLSAS